MAWRGINQDVLWMGGFLLLFFLLIGIALIGSWWQKRKRSGRLWMQMPFQIKNLF